MAALNAGQQMGEFTLTEPLDATQHAWLASDAGGRPWLLQAMQSSNDAERRLQQLQALRHPVFPGQFKILDHNGQCFLASPAPQQYQRLDQLSLELEPLLMRMRRVCEALHQADEAGVPHGALANNAVVIDEGGQLCIWQFAAEPAGNGEDDRAALADLFRRCLQRLPASHPRDTDGQPVQPPRLRQVLARLGSQPANQTGATSLLEVAEELDDIRLQWQRIRREGIPPSWLDEAPVQLGDSAPMASASASAGRSRWLGWGLVAVLMLTLLATVFLLPDDSTETVAPQAAVVAEEEEVTEAPPRPPTEAELEALLVMREIAQEILDEFILARLGLEEQHVELWAQKAFDSAIATKEAGDEPMRNQAFPVAIRQYQSALDQLRSLAEQAGRELEEALAAGHAALDRGDAAAATTAFELALAIEAEQPAAIRGLERAGKLDQVLALLAEARELDQQDQWVAARERYREAQALDPETRGPAEAIERLDGLISDQAFRDAMSEGLAALDRGALGVAGEAFNRARQLRPGSAGPAEGLQEIQRRTRESGLQQLRERALLLESEERWDAAVADYQSMLQRDPNLAFAIEGSEYARERARLDRDLEARLTDPPSWWTSKGREEAESLLQDARSVARSGPRLERQMAELENLIEQAHREVRLQLVSDGLCQVMVYKVGRLGTFERTELTLFPGRYTIVGTRDGYRDVRFDVLVPPEPLPEPVRVHCDERIAEAL